jgi:hypothetical protein
LVLVQPLKQLLQHKAITAMIQYLALSHQQQVVVEGPQLQQQEGLTVKMEVPAVEHHGTPLGRVLLVQQVQGTHHL